MSLLHCSMGKSNLALSLRVEEAAGVLQQLQSALHALPSLHCFVDMSNALHLCRASWQYTAHATEAKQYSNTAYASCTAHNHH